MDRCNDVQLFQSLMHFGRQLQYNNLLVLWHACRQISRIPGDHFELPYKRREHPLLALIWPFNCDILENVYVMIAALRTRRFYTVVCLLIFCISCRQKAADNKKVTTASLTDNTDYSFASQRERKDSIRVKIPNYPLRNEKDLDVLLEQIGDARVVLLGEATHGTSEFYTWRAAITKRLIEEKNFDFIASESEWADSYRVNNFVKGPLKDSNQVIQLLHQYNRWPTWMWGNTEIASLVNWLNKYNQGKGSEEKVGFFGLDVYCLWESMS